MTAVMRDMGLDPAEGIDASDFVTFFRRAEELTMDLEPKGPTHCVTNMCVCIIFLLIAACCVFTLLLFEEEDDEAMRNGCWIG